MKNRIERGIVWGILGFLVAMTALLKTNAEARSVMVERHANITENMHRAEIVVRRTTDGIAHVRANGWYELGYGYGYVQAQDALCTMADAFVTYAGERALFFGPDSRPAHNSTIGRPKNIESDVFFRAFADAAMVSAYKQQQPRDLQVLIQGFAAGYSRYIRDMRKARSSPHACLHEAWVREISEDDIYRRMFSANIAAGYAHFIPQIVNAVSGNSSALHKHVMHRHYPVGDQAALGSNVIAFGKQATHEDGAVLFGNPHWYWGGPDRFYQAHLTIPGKFNVAGVSFLGIPVIMIGFNDHIAWSHTVSEARRFGLFELALDSSDATRYRYDGVSEAMQAVTVQVPLQNKNGLPQHVSRTVYRTRFGPVVDLSEQNSAFGWGRNSALAIRDINADNFRVFRNFFYWNQARSLNDFIAIQRREAGMPWANTVAIGRNDGRVWYADIGAVPNVTDAQRTACATSLSQAFNSADPLTPFLDGSRPACNWGAQSQTNERAIPLAAMPVVNLPNLLRSDYVANMNDSYWLSNPRQPLEGFAGLLGGERQAVSLRTRYGHSLAARLIQENANGGSKALSQRLMSNALDPHSFAADQFKNNLLASVCAKHDVALPSKAEKEPEPTTVKQVNIAEACGVLQRWSNTANANDRGALLWDAFWSRLEDIPGDEFYRVPFSAKSPLTTPRDPNATDPRIAQALAAAVFSFADNGWKLDAPLNEQRFVRSGGQRIALFGGCHATGYFTVACNADGSYEINRNSVANTYLQVVYFDKNGVNAHTLLSHGLRDESLDDGMETTRQMDVDPAVNRYAHKAWLHFPFYERDIARDPALVSFTLYP